MNTYTEQPDHDGYILFQDPPDQHGSMTWTLLPRHPENRSAYKMRYRQIHGGSLQQK